MFAYISFIVPILTATAVLADNDWSTPCFSGVCEYDLPASNTSASGTLKIWGSDTAISDITPAAGWEIISCSPEALQQDIRLVCKNDNSSGCSHLFSNSSGAVGKVVRLPQNCGKGPFAVVTKSYVPEDQSIPSNMSSLLTRRDGSKPTVQGLSLSTNFSSAASSVGGPVNFAIQAANVPGANGKIVIPSQQQPRSNSRVFGRSFLTNFVNGAINSISSLDTFNVSKNDNLPPFDINKTFNLVNKNISCPPATAGITIDLDTQAHAVASIGVAATGTILPPAVSDFAVIVSLNAELDGTLLINASASATLNSGNILLFQVGIPGLDFPGVLTIGPSFEINGEATATLDVDVDLAVGISYVINGAQFTFPPNGNQGGSFDIQDTPLQLSATPSVTATGSVAAHLIPSLNLGISALGSAVDASVFLELDASATMTLSATVQASASETIGRRVLQALPERPFWQALRVRQNDQVAESTNDSDAPASSDDNEAGYRSDDADSIEDDTTEATPDANTTATNDADSSDTTVDDSESDTDSISNDNTTQSNSPTDPDDLSDEDDSADDSTDETSSGNSGVESSDGPSTNNTALPAGGAATVSVDGAASNDGASASADALGDTAGPLDLALTSNNSTNLTSAGASAGTTNQTVAAGSTSASFGGCFEIDAALDVNVGGTGSFFGLFDANMKLDLFNKQFTIFKKCFGSSATRRSFLGIASQRSLPNRLTTFPQKRAFNLACLAADKQSSQGHQSIADGTVSASVIKQI